MICLHVHDFNMRYYIVHLQMLETQHDTSYAWLLVVIARKWVRWKNLRQNQFIEIEPKIDFYNIYTLKAIFVLSVTFWNRFLNYLPYTDLQAFFLHWTRGRPNKIHELVSTPYRPKDTFFIFWFPPFFLFGPISH